MGGMGSGGIGFVAELRRQARREEGRREQRRAQHQARHAGIRALRESGVECSAPMRWPFACASVCGQCGALALPAAPATSGSTTTDAQTRCARCNAQGNTLIDLGNREMADALVTSEVHDRKIHAARHRAVGGPIATTVLFAALAVVAFILGVAPIVGATLAAAGVLPGTVAAQRWSGQQSAPTRARRWAHQPRATGPTSETTGVASGELRQAPLTGRTCLGYDVRVVWSGEPATSPAAMALQEQVTHGMKLGATDASRAYVALAPQRISGEQVIASPAAVRYLATRGLEPTDGGFDYYETLILEQDVLVTKTDAAGRQEIVSA